MPKSSI